MGGKHAQVLKSSVARRNIEIEYQIIPKIYLIDEKYNISFVIFSKNSKRNQWVRKNVTGSSIRCSWIYTCDSVKRNELNKAFKFLFTYTQIVCTKIQTIQEHGKHHQLRLIMEMWIEYATLHWNLRAFKPNKWINMFKEWQNVYMEQQIVFKIYSFFFLISQFDENRNVLSLRMAFIRQERITMFKITFMNLWLYWNDKNAFGLNEK